MWGYGGGDAIIGRKKKWLNWKFDFCHEKIRWWKLNQGFGIETIWWFNNGWYEDDVFLFEKDTSLVKFLLFLWIKVYDCNF